MDNSASLSRDSTDSAIRVFLLDDHEVVRRGIADVLETDGITIVGEAATAAEALRRIPATSPDVAILDARLPDGSGIDVCRDIRSSMPAVRCLILTHDDADAVFAAVMEVRLVICSSRSAGRPSLMPFDRLRLAVRC
jgi:DNA-binding NarL/FixJ family response regulator